MQKQMYEYTESRVAILLKGLSSERLARYAELAPNNRSKQLQLYAWNTELSESLYTPIQGLEIIARNYFHNALTKGFGEAWYENKKIAFQYSQMCSIEHAKETLIRERKRVCPSNLLSHLSFGFWTGLLAPKYETILWRSCLYKAFKNKPVPFLRKSTHREFDLIRMLRNRIAHHEPILREDLPKHYIRILSMIGWFCDETAKWTESKSRFNIVWHSPINPYLKDWIATAALLPHNDEQHA